LPISSTRLHLCLLAAAVAIAGGGGDSETETTGSTASFEPRASLRAVGGTERTDKPALVLRIVARPGDVNIRSAAVNLPPVVLVDAEAITGFCSERELKADRCAGHQRLGRARVLSPAYAGELSGPVYPVTGSGRLATLAYVLGGPAEVVLRGRVVSADGRIQAGVEDVPDTPLRSFELTISGGPQGYLILSQDICRGEPMADAEFTSQDGQDFERRISLEAACGP
jgi:hypothetical protein